MSICPRGFPTLPYLAAFSSSLALTFRLSLANPPQPVCMCACVCSSYQELETSSGAVIGLSQGSCYCTKCLTDIFQPLPLCEYWIYQHAQNLRGFSLISPILRITAAVNSSSLWGVLRLEFGLRQFLFKWIIGSFEGRKRERFFFFWNLNPQNFCEGSLPPI